MASRFPRMADCGCGWYLVDNSELKDPSPDIEFRQSRDLNDRVRPVSADKRGLIHGDISKEVKWGTRLRGRDCGDGWFMFATDRYLPFRVNGYSILTAIPPQKIPGSAYMLREGCRWLLPVVLGSAEAAPILSKIRDAACRESELQRCAVLARACRDALAARASVAQPEAENVLRSDELQANEIRPDTSVCPSVRPPVESTNR